LKIRNVAALIDYVNHGNKVKYVFFWGHQRPAAGVSKSCFSQWYDSPFEEGGHRYLTAEHYMMHKKALLFGDAGAALRLLEAKNPGEAKAIGREVQGFDQARWETYRFEIVVAANLGKFGSNAELKAFLLNTGDRVLVETSPVDKVWGIGLAENDPDCENPNKWKGENLLGFALMEVRDRLGQNAAPDQLKG
tara:strand:- start:1248 stop:1823 length:576 start_codon:yes stop_codon:yes gene_type:complete